MVKGSLQSELNTYFQHRDHRKFPKRQVTSSAFCKARQKFSETAFIELNHRVTEAFYTDSALQKWLGFRVLAVDGSKYLLPDEPSVYATYGGMTNQYEKSIPMALGSCLYDVFQGLILDARFTKYKGSERDLAHQHMDYSQPDDLTLYDRGYPAFWLFAAHQDQESHFCMRARVDFNSQTKAFALSNKKQDTVVFKANDRMKLACKEKGVSSEDISVRLIRIKTSKGEYILITNLLNKRRYPLKAFKELYHLRWQIEEGYKKQKNWLEMENFTGRSVLAIKQDFHARILCQTLTAITAYAAQDTMKLTVQGRMLSYKINFVSTLSAMKNTLIHLLSNKLSCEEIRQWLYSIGQELSPIRAARSFTRKKKVTDRHKFHMAFKRAL